MVDCTLFESEAEKACQVRVMLRDGKPSNEHYWPGVKKAPVNYAIKVKLENSELLNTRQI